MHDCLLNSLSKKHCKRVGYKQHHGVCTPLFALHSKQSCGIGEFLDLLPMIDWVKSLGMDTIQLLPLNDTCKEISPYSPISVMALNPIYLAVSRLPSINQAKGINKLRRLTRSQLIDYETVRYLKNKVLKVYFKDQYLKVKKRQSYRDFLASQGWLEVYATFTGEEIDYCVFVQYLCYQQLKDKKKS